MASLGSRTFCRRVAQHINSAPCVLRVQGSAVRPIASLFARQYTQYSKRRCLQVRVKIFDRRATKHADGKGLDPVLDGRVIVTCHSANFLPLLHVPLCHPFGWHAVLGSRARKLLTSAPHATVKVQHLSCACQVPALGERAPRANRTVCRVCCVSFAFCFPSRSDPQRP